MPLRIGNVTIDDSMDLKIGTELVGGMKVGGDIVYEWQAPATVFEWSGALNKRLSGVPSKPVIDMPRNSATPLPSEWVVGGGAAYIGLVGSFSYPVIERDGRVLLRLSSSADSTTPFTAGPQLTPDAESGLRMEFTHATAGTLVITGTGSDTDEPYDWVVDNVADVTAWVNAVSDGDNVAIRFSLGSTPPPAPASHSFELTADRINAAAAGKFGGLTETFTLGGQEYTITYLFTHNNGVQFRFSTNAQALAFIAADFSVDLGIAGQSAFDSSLMQNRVDVNWAQYAAYAGRFVAGSTYTITITEAS